LILLKKTDFLDAHFVTSCVRDARLRAHEAAWPSGRGRRRHWQPGWPRAPATVARAHSAKSASPAGVAAVGRLARATAVVRVEHRLDAMSNPAPPIAAPGCAVALPRDTGAAFAAALDELVAFDASWQRSTFDPHRGSPSGPAEGLRLLERLRLLRLAQLCDPAFRRVLPLQ
jgi:hypothetical protein